MTAANLIVWGLVFVALYAFVVLPKQRQQQKQDAMLSSIDEGDEVLLNSGIYGFVTLIDGPTLWLEVADNVELKVARSSVAGKVLDDDDSDDDVEQADKPEQSGTADKVEDAE